MILRIRLRQAPPPSPIVRWEFPLRVKPRGVVVFDILDATDTVVVQGQTDETEAYAVKKSLEETQED